MIVGEIDIKWDMGYEAAADLLQAVETLAETAGITRVDGIAFKAVKFEVGTEHERIVVTIQRDFYGT